MKIAFICDMHLPNNRASAQYAYFSEFIKRMKKDKIETVICLGDITSFGEKEIFLTYLEDLKDFDHHFVIGNSDVRDENTKDFFLEKSGGFLIERDGRAIMGVDTPYGVIEESDREKISRLKNGDVFVMHYYVEALEKESREFLTGICEDKALTVIVGHQHKKRDYMLGRSRVIGLRALDPDKSIGGYPCIDYFDFSGDGVEDEEIIITSPVSILRDIRAHFGISCVDNLRDLTYALENEVYAVELRTNGADWTPDLSLIPLIERWRARTGGYLSVHFPNLGYKNGEITGKEQWIAATEYAIAIKADGLTMHPPRRVRLCDIPEGGEVWNALAEMYLYTIKKMPEQVAVGIENLHMEAGEGDNIQRSFGYTPIEVSAWIDMLNTALNKPNRVGHIFDVGHARNNGHLSQIYPVSRWYEMMGNKTVAYHIHQVLAGERGMSNHNAIETWLGPIINYTSFFYSWEKGVINHKPIFLEVQGSVNYEKSINAFEKLLSSSTMKDVFVLYGRVKWNDGIFSEWGNEYFGESPVLELFEDFQSAYERFRLYVKEAHQYFFDAPYYMLDTDLVEKARPAEIFADYNMHKDEYSYGEIQWEFSLKENESASWQMYAVNIDTKWCPILAGLHIKKTSFNPDAKKFNS